MSEKGGHICRVSSPVPPRSVSAHLKLGRGKQIATGHSSSSFPGVSTSLKVVTTLTTSTPDHRETNQRPWSQAGDHLDHSATSKHPKGKGKIRNILEFRPTEVSQETTYATWQQAKSDQELKKKRINGEGQKNIDEPLSV